MSYESPVAAPPESADEPPVDWLLAERGVNLSLAGTALLSVTMLALVLDPMVLTGFAPVVRDSLMQSAMLLGAGGLVALASSNLCWVLALSDVGGRRLAMLAAAGLVLLPLDLIHKGTGVPSGVLFDPWSGILLGGFFIGLAAHLLVMRGLAVRLGSAVIAWSAILVAVLWLAASVVSHFSNYTFSHQREQIFIERLTPQSREIVLTALQRITIPALLGTLAAGAIVRAAVVGRPVDDAATDA
jgi:hypothetical protein